MAERECENTGCDRSSCEGCPSAQKKPASMKEEANQYSCVRRVIGVVSGKGGVGKSMVTASMANDLASRGYQVGIMDADITGPSIPRMYGIHGAAMGSDMGIEPRVAENGVKIISMNLLLPSEETPVIWRGPIISGVVKQFWTDVIWGDLDYLLVDMPPGTGDVALTVFQSLPVDEIVVVTSPQDLVSMIVKKALSMAEQMNIPVKGIVENFSYMECPDCGRRLYPFGESRLDDVAAELKIPILGRIPIDPSFSAAADAGEFASVKNDYLTMEA